MNAGFAAYSVISGVGTLAGWMTPFVLAGAGGVVTVAGLCQRIAILAGWQWIVVLALIELGVVVRPMVAERA